MLQAWAAEELQFPGLEVALLGHSQVTGQEDTDPWRTGLDIGDDLALMVT